MKNYYSKNEFIKIILLFLVFISINNLHAQQYETKIDSMLINIDKTSLINNILYERSNTVAKLQQYNDSTNVSNVKYFEQALTDLYLASNKQLFMPSNIFKDFYSDISQKNQVDIGVINCSFHTLNFKENEQESALIITNNLFEKMNNDKEPFLQKEVLIISALKQNLRGNEIVFNFHKKFFFQENTNRTIQTITANFDTNTDYIIYENNNFNNQSIDIEYIETGVKTLTFLVEFTNNTSITTQSIIYVKGIPSNPLPTDINSTCQQPQEPFIFVNSNPETQWDGAEYGETEQINGKLEYRVFYSSNNTECKILKPIIFIDGFDPDDSRKIIDSDSDTPNIDHSSILELMNYYVNNDRFEIIDELRNMGYDVIIVNQPDYRIQLPDTYFEIGNPNIGQGELITVHHYKTIHGGGDYIERNGLNHVAFYQFINQELEDNNSDEQLVIVGPSMGGLISRYALAFMEKKYEETNLDEWRHNCRLWISLDSPHLGANISLGVQSLLHTAFDVTGSNSVKYFIDVKLNSPAARQLLIEQYAGAYSNGYLNPQYQNAQTISQGFSINRGHPYFIKFYDNLFTNGILGSRGYPQNLRKVAMVNGSLTSSKDFDSPYFPNKIFVSNPYPHYEYSLEPIPNNNTILHQYGTDSELSLKINGLADYIGITSSMSAYFMPPIGDSSEISFFKKKKTFGFDHYPRYTSNHNSRGNLDIIPGGWFSTQKDVAEATVDSNIYTNVIGAGPSSEWIDWGVTTDNWDVIKLQHVQSFIPIVSALGFYNPNFNWNSDINRDLVCTNEIPFDNFYAPEKNESHVSFTEDSFNWFKAELLNIDGTNPPETTTYQNNNINLTGDNTICFNQLKTYTLDVCDSSENIIWTVHNDLQIESSDNSHVIVKCINTDATELWIRATYPNGSIATKYLESKPSITVEITGSLVYKAVLHGAGNNTNISWVKTGGAGTLYLTNNDRVAISLNNYSISGNVTVTNDCGSVTLPFFIPASQIDNCNQISLIKIDNNKYKTQIINPCNDNSTGINTNINDTKLFDTYGIEYQNIQCQANQIDINNNQSGSVKIIKAIVGDKVIIKRVIVD